MTDEEIVPETASVWRSSHTPYVVVDLTPCLADEPIEVTTKFEYLALRLGVGQHVQLAAQSDSDEHETIHILLIPPYVGDQTYPNGNTGERDLVDIHPFDADKAIGSEYDAQVTFRSFPKDAPISLEVCGSASTARRARLRLVSSSFHKLDKLLVSNCTLGATAFGQTARLVQACNSIVSLVGRGATYSRLGNDCILSNARCGTIEVDASASAGLHAVSLEAASTLSIGDAARLTCTAGSRLGHVKALGRASLVIEDPRGDYEDEPRDAGRWVYPALVTENLTELFLSMGAIATEFSSITGMPGSPLEVIAESEAAISITGTLEEVILGKDCWLFLDGLAVATRCKFVNVLIVLSSDALILESWGTLSIALARRSTIRGSQVTASSEALKIRLANETEIKGLKNRFDDTHQRAFESFDNPLQDAVLQFFMLDPGRSIRLLSAARECQIFDPNLRFKSNLDKRATRTARKTAKDPEWTAADELLGQVCGQKASFGSIRCAAEYRSMEARRRTTQSTAEYLLLLLYKSVGYGRRPTFALVAFLLLAVGECVWKLRDGLNSPTTDIAIRAGLYVFFPPLAVLARDTPPTSIDLLFRSVVSVALAFTIVAVGRYGRISRKID